MNSGKWGSKLKHWALLLLFLSHTTCLPLTPAPTLTAHNQYLNLSLEVESINAPLILLIGPRRFDDPPERKQYVPLFQGILGRNMYFSIFPVCYFWDIGTGADLLANSSDRQVQKTESSIVGNFHSRIDLFRYSFTTATTVSSFGTANQNLGYFMNTWFL